MDEKYYKRLIATMKRNFGKGLLYPAKRYRIWRIYRVSHGYYSLSFANLFRIQRYCMLGFS